MTTVFGRRRTQGYFDTFGLTVAARTRPDQSGFGRLAARGGHQRSDGASLLRRCRPGRTTHPLENQPNESMTIRRVVRDTVQNSFRNAPPRMIYVPLAQDRLAVSPVLYMALRTSGSPIALASSVRADARALNREVVIDSLRTMEQQIDAMLIRERVIALLSTSFGVLAVLLAFIGLYGVTSYDVSRRVRDIGSAGPWCRAECPSESEFCARPPASRSGHVLGVVGDRRDRGPVEAPLWSGAPRSRNPGWDGRRVGGYSAAGGVSPCSQSLRHRPGRRPSERVSMNVAFSPNCRTPQAAEP